MNKSPTTASPDRSKPRVLVVEDEGDIRDLIRFHLEKEGFVVETANTGDRGLDLALSRSYDVALLDLMLPGMDGYEICRRIRREPKTAGLPVLMVTSRGQEKDVVDGLNIGADDYITKPFSLKELSARVRTAVRRTQTQTTGGHARPLNRGRISVDPLRHEVLVDGQPVVLTMTEFRLLQHLMKHAGRVFTRQELMPHVIGEGVVVIDRNIDVHIGNLRKKLGAGGDAVATVRGLGYRFDDQKA